MANMKKAVKTFTGSTVVITFADGNVLSCDLAELSNRMQEKCALHGLAQKVGDAFAGSGSVMEAIASATQVWEALLRGDWSSRSTGGILAEAIARAMGITITEAIEARAGMDDATKRKLRKHPAILKAIAEIMAERGGDEAESLGSIIENGG